MKNLVKKIKQIYDEAGTEGFTRGNGCFGVSGKHLGQLYDAGYVVDDAGGGLKLSKKALALIGRQAKAEASKKVN